MFPAGKFVAESRLDQPFGFAPRAYSGTVSESLLPFICTT
jgi:hypothetical protein